MHTQPYPRGCKGVCRCVFVQSGLCVPVTVCRYTCLSTGAYVCVSTNLRVCVCVQIRVCLWGWGGAMPAMTLRTIGLMIHIQ